MCWGKCGVVVCTSRPHTGYWITLVLRVLRALCHPLQHSRFISKGAKRSSLNQMLNGIDSFIDVSKPMIWTFASYVWHFLKKHFLSVLAGKLFFSPRGEPKFLNWKPSGAVLANQELFGRKRNWLELLMSWPDFYHTILFVLSTQAKRLNVLFFYVFFFYKSVNWDR